MKRSERKEAKQELRDATQELLGSVIVGFRKKADLSQEDLAYESGVVYEQVVSESCHNGNYIVY